MISVEQANIGVLILFIAFIIFVCVDQWRKR